MEIAIQTAAIILRIAASVLAFRLIRLSRGWMAWTLIAVAVFLTSIRLAITLLDALQGTGQQLYALQEHMLSLFISFLLLAGFYAIRPLFLAFHRSEEDLRRARSEAELRAAEAEELLEENRLRVAELEAIFEATQDGIALYGPKGEVLSMNAASREFFGYTPDEQGLGLDRRWALLRAERMDGTPLPPEEIPGKRALAGEKVRAILHLRPQRRPARWFSVSSAPIRPVGASAASAVTMFTDVTEVRELQQEQEIFMQMISHDLRSPVTVIQGHAELLAGQLSERDEMIDLHLEAISAATRQLAGMMEDLSDMIQLERGQLPSLNLERIDMPEFITKLVHRMMVTGGGRAVEKVFPPDLPPVFADRVSLERILTNLITNAFKYSPAETSVRIAAEAVGDEVEISVSDCGKGILHEEQPYLFERFFRAGDVGRKKGIGLGLYITRKLVEAHKGRVWVVSEPGRGSVFTFSLPLRLPEDR